MKKFDFGSIFLYFLALCVLLIGPLELFASQTVNEDKAPRRKMAQQVTKSRQLWITADHSRHDVLQQDFTSGPEVTKACLSCHSEAAAQFH